MVQRVKVALEQFYSEKGTVADNLERIVCHYQVAVRAGMEVVAFPEMSLTGYIDPSHCSQAVLRVDGIEVARLAAATAGQPAALLVGLVEENPVGRPFITQVLLQDGRLTGVYRKRTIEGEEAELFAPGERPLVFTQGGVRIGVAICADIGNAVVFADCAAAGAQMILELAAPGLYGDLATRDWAAGFSWWQKECRNHLARYARAYGVWIGVATQAGRTRDEDFPGGGYLFAPDGTCVGLTPHWAPGVLYAEVELDSTRARVYDREADR